ncbi:MAG: dihydroxyacetone kinase subunit DhaK [Acidobacteriota bacterium]|nr:dihydroxyacetone kinase subunit DhaK [Acidobacteriota bacterium]
MKKILNEPFAYVDEMLEGLCLAHPQYYKQTGTAGRVIVRADGPIKGKVGIVSGGGSGHLPVFTGYVGKGLVDACAIGDVFSSPAVDQVAEAIRAANGGVGVLRLYGNYGGDKMNFDMAGEMVEMEDIPSTSVRVADDVASAPLAERAKRRGVAGLVYAYKIAGAKADQHSTLQEVTAVAQKAADACRSVGVALTPCTVPAVGRPTFAISETEMEIGMGIHGEPGVRRGSMRPADAIAEEMLSLLLADIPLQAGDRISILVNSLGATPPEELYIVYRYVARKLVRMGIEIIMPLVGRYATSMEMAGMSLTIGKLDAELEALLKAPCDCPFLKV